MVFIFQLVCLLFLALAPAASQAADPATFKPQVEIPGMKKEFGAPDKTGGYAIPGSTASIAKYIRVIYKYAIGIVGILAAVVLMIGGVIWITAGGNAERIGEAKAWIASSLTGLLLALLSYTILATVNPALVNFQISEVKTVEEMSSGCCEKTKSSGICSTSITQDQCKSDYWKPGLYNCNNQGNCVFSLNRCCVHADFSYDYIPAEKCKDKQVNKYECCIIGGINEYKLKVDNDPDIKSCDDLPKTSDGSF